MKTALITIALFVLAGCAQNPLQEAVLNAGSAVSDNLRDTAETSLCRAITVGTWVRAYGSDAKRAEAWRTLCSTHTTELPR